MIAAIWLTILQSSLSTGGTSSLPLERLQNLLRKRSAEVLAHHDLARRATQHALLRSLLHGDPSGYWLASLGDNDSFTLTNPVQQPRQVGLGLLEAHRRGHLSNSPSCVPRRTSL